ncbi:MAG: antibiotic biosynthesis monooxygenase [Acidobacteriota bacterium]|nr:antibiotic biosynthesis monooxygenase [Acidobacteriota bacterium]
MTTISKENEVVTPINVFTVRPENQQQLVDLLIEATKKTMRHLPGFVSANIHKSFDGTKVVNYAQWRSVEDFLAIKQNPEARPHMQAAAALGDFDPILCEVSDSIGIDGEGN